MKIFGVVIAVLIALGIWHELNVFASRGNPPVSCQLLGGQWNMFTGWHCGVSSSDSSSPDQQSPPAPAPAPAAPVTASNGPAASDVPTSVNLGATYAVTSLTWTNWTYGPSATATGVLDLRNCQPSCAQGSTREVPVTITVSGGTAPYYTHYSITSASDPRVDQSGDLPPGWAGGTSGGQ